MTAHDPLNAWETAKVVRLGIKGARLEAEGRSTASTDREIERIRKGAWDREKRRTAALKKMLRVK